MRTHLSVLVAACLTIVSAASVTLTGNDLRVVQAVKNQLDPLAVGALLKEGADVNARQGDGATALHWAAHWDNRETVDLLISAGAAVNSKNDLGVTPLWLACLNRSVAVIENLLKAGADPNAALASGETPLMTASRTGNTQAVGLLLAHGAKVNASEGYRGQTALMWAVAQQHPAVVRLLIESGADIHGRSRARPVRVTTGDQDPIYDIEEGGFTPLLFAAQQGNLESVRILMAAGAKVNDTAPYGTSALVVAAHSGHRAVAEFLLDNGADPNAGGAGYTALHLAIVIGPDLELVKALLARGANPNAVITRSDNFRRNYVDSFAVTKDLIGGTPFWVAARLGAVDIMRALAANGADPLLANKGITALMAAAMPGRRRGFGQPIDWSADERRVQAVKLAVELGVDVAAVNGAGETVLHMAAGEGYDAVVQVLVDGGAKLDAKNKRGQTPLAKAKGKSTGDLLRKLGATE